VECAPRWPHTTFDLLNWVFNERHLGRWPQQDLFQNAKVWIQMAQAWPKVGPAPICGI